LPSEPKVLVVGTTADYVDWIRRINPEGTLFLTDPDVRRHSPEPCPPPAEEILCDLSDYNRVRQILRHHLLKLDLRLGGIACFDCESMELAAVLGREWSLPYPSVQAVNNCRNKFTAKRLWESFTLQCPRARLIRSACDAIEFFHELGGPCVLKPLNGSGSELIFRCDSEDDCRTSMQKIQGGLLQRRTNRLYKFLSNDEPMILAEEFVSGDEFSCDFIIENGRAEIIRLTRKILSSHAPLGTARGYFLSAVIPDEIDEGELRWTLNRSTSALGISRAICMLDFMIYEGRIVLLELAPRPGGDCLPFLLRRCWNLDLLKLTLDFCRNGSFHFEKISDSVSYLGLRLHAPHGGVLKKIDARQLQQDKRVREIHLPRQEGHQIRMPPDDYDSWLLGHIIVEADQAIDLQMQCREHLEKLILEIV